MTERIPPATVSRMAMYLRCLRDLEEQEKTIVSSRELALLLGVTPEQVRQDFLIVGCTGKCGAGYDVVRLKHRIECFFGRDADHWTCCMVGMGDLGRALISSEMVQDWGFRYVAAFDTDPHRIGTRFHGIPIYALSQLKAVVQREQIGIGVITVCASLAHRAAGLLRAAGIRGILNFAPEALKTSEQTPIVLVDFSREFLKLAFYIQSAESRSREEQAQIQAVSAGE